MTPQQIAADVARGLEIKAEIGRLTAELKLIESRLEAAGLEGEQIPLQDKDREGKQFLARGRDKIIPIRFESDQLIASFLPDTETHQAVKDIAGDKMDHLFKEVRKFDRTTKDGYTFRKLAREILDADRFARLIHACTARTKDGLAKSKTIIAWDDAKPIDQATA